MQILEATFPQGQQILQGKPQEKEEIAQHSMNQQDFAQQGRVADRQQILGKAHERGEVAQLSVDQQVLRHPQQILVKAQESAQHDIDQQAIVQQGMEHQSKILVKAHEREEIAQQGMNPQGIVQQGMAQQDEEEEQLEANAAEVLAQLTSQGTITMLQYPSE